MRRLLFPALLGFAALAGAQATPPKSDWERQQEERDWKDAEVRLPAYPKDEGLIEFFVSGASSFRFFIDPASLSVGADGVVRYTMIARSPAGVANVSYEGIRCTTGVYRILAFGNNDRWSAHAAEWREIQPKSVQRWHNELRGRYFCPLGRAIDTAAEGVDALRRGGHPATANTGHGR